MLKEPRHLPVYVASYLDNNKIEDNSIISKISNSTSKKAKNNLIESTFNRPIGWGGKAVLIESICINDLPLFNIHNCRDNTFNYLDAKLVSKDIWIKAVNKANKLIDEENKKNSTKIKRIPY